MQFEIMEIKIIKGDITKIKVEAIVNAEYRGTLDYPSQKRKYDRDMGPVLRARKLLE